MTKRPKPPNYTVMVLSIEKYRTDINSILSKRELVSVCSLPADDYGKLRVLVTVKEST